MIGADLSNPVSDLEDGKGFGLGDRYCSHDGKEYVFVQANGAISQYDAVIIDESYQADQLDTTNSGSGFGDLVGVAPFAFADDDYGWVQVKGPCTVNVGSSCATNTQLNSTGTAGRIDDDAAVGSEDITGIVTTGAESSNTAAAMLNYPTVGVTN